MKTRRRKKKEEEEEERERGWKGRILVTYQPSVRPVGPLLLHRKLEGRPLPRERSHEEEEGEAKRGHEVDTRRGRHGGRLVSLRLQSAAPQKSKSFFLLRRFLFLSFSDSIPRIHWRVLVNSPHPKFSPHLSENSVYDVTLSPHPSCFFSISSSLLRECSTGKKDREEREEREPIIVKERKYHQKVFSH